MKRLKNIDSIFKIFFCLLVGFPLSIQAQLITSNSLTPQQLVQDVLLGNGITATNITFTGSADAIGFFKGNTNLGIDSGIVMTTGTIFSPNGPEGPNNGGSVGINNSAPGDVDLATITGKTTFNAAVLEFDFIPSSDSIKFRYVFGSEEYMEYAGTGFNDAFAFILSGVTTTLAPTNIALIPGTSTPVTINNVNLNSNSSYYFDNENPPGETIQYDGFTTVLTARAKVICGETYHIKLAISDVGDGVWDSGVFLEAGSFQGTAFAISSHVDYGTNDTTLYEGCGGASLVFSRGHINLQNPDTFFFTIDGTAINGTDFTFVPDSVFFAIGQDSIILDINALTDLLPEGSEKFTITLIPKGNCYNKPVSITISISDILPITALASNDIRICPGKSTNISATCTGGVPPLLYSWSDGAGSTSTVSVSPSQTTNYVVTVTDNCASDTVQDNVTVNVPLPLQLNTDPNVEVCLGDSIQLSALVTGGASPYIYSWTTVSGTDSVRNSSLAQTYLTPKLLGVYKVTITDSCSNVTVSDDITVDVRAYCELIIPNIYTPNGDGNNEKFEITNMDRFPGSRLLFYNRWGNKVFEDADYQNTWNGKDVSDGVYYYVLHVSDGRTLTGFVTIIR